MSKKALENASKQKKILEGDVIQMTHQIGFSLQHAANKLIDSVEHQLKEVKRALNTANETIKVTQDQIDNGVEVKEEKK